ncbi:hypothetical protein M422DRAFT_221380 [Sphaerobolus stellatus SS14]|nr:hypothetical protein M422DRAFT_221380 [Sphaerobolus stellatus SS14]
MAPKISTTSQRATATNRKVVFKSVLENPYKVSWPNVPLNVQNIILASLINLLSSATKYNNRRQEISKKRKRERHEKKRNEKESRKRRKTEHDESTTKSQGEAATSVPTSKGEIKSDTEGDTEGDAAMEQDTITEHVELEAPPIIAHLTVGINAVTKRLESQSQSRRIKTTVTASEDTSINSDSTAERSPIKYVFVCRADVDPPLLIAHLPELIAACNVPSPSRAISPVYLVPLPKGAERSLADTLALPRVSIIALDSSAPLLESVSSHLEGIYPPSAPWLTIAAEKLSVSHVPTHIKQLSTTAPKDFRGAKKERIEGRKAAIEKKKEKKKEKRFKEKPAATVATVTTAGNKLPKATSKWKRRVTVITKTTTVEPGDSMPS